MEVYRHSYVHLYVDNVTLRAYVENEGLMEQSKKTGDRRRRVITTVGRGLCQEHSLRGRGSRHPATDVSHCQVGRTGASDWTACLIRCDCAAHSRR